MDKTKSTVVGNLEIIENFEMPELNNRLRTIRIWTPSNYDKTKKYPVIYAHDGQNLFDESTSYAGEWGIDETIEQLITINKTKGFIVVGIDNGHSLRLSEYIPNLNKDSITEGSKYASFIVNTLKPYIDKKYNTLADRNNTIIMGSSLGGLISFYTGLKYQNIFGHILAFSTSFKVIDKKDLNNFIKSLNFSDAPKLYLDAGSLENAQNFLQPVKEILLKNGYSDKLIKTKIEYGHLHNEAAWKIRFPEALIWSYLNKEQTGK